MSQTVRSQDDPVVLPNATNRVAAVFDSPDAADEAMRAIEQIEGVCEIDVRCGVVGAQQLDMDGDHQGVKERTVRKAHKSTDWIEMERFAEELKAGHCILSFRADQLSDLDPVVHVIRAHGGRYVHHFGAVAVTLLHP